MKIRALKLRIATDEGEFGFSFIFTHHLTIIRARNSSGKSTLFNSLLYGLGMEELIGGKGEQVLPYAVREFFEYDDRRITVVASEVLVEIENLKGDTVTLRRTIKHPQRQSKLIEIFSGKCLTDKAPMLQPKPTYLHDAGSAQRDEGYYHFLENFMQLNLPQVSTTSGSQTKLYLQTIFAAVAIEQKRGWTDYIAGIPFYGIRECRTRVAEYLLGLEVFEVAARRAQLDKESVEVHNEWLRLTEEFQSAARLKGISTENLPTKPDPFFDRQKVQLLTFSENQLVPVTERISALRAEYKSLNTQTNDPTKKPDENSISELERLSLRLKELTFLHEQNLTNLNFRRTSNREYEQLLQETAEDLAKNKTVKKLRSLGAEADISIASDKCPTCHQFISDSLLREVVVGPIMSIDENINYLDMQRGMLERQIAGGHKVILNLEERITSVSSEITHQISRIESLRRDISSGASESRSTIRRQLQIEAQVEDLQAVQDRLSPLSERLSGLANTMIDNRAARKMLPKEKYSESDMKKIQLFQKMFRANAGSFGYESAEINEITIHPDTLTPTLQQIELREISSKAVDLTHNSSASDFVRLIWSYLLALFQTSSNKSVHGNHPAVLLMDEPGQHSMRVESQHALLRELAGNANLQSIIAASFDENKSVFEEATSGLDYQLIEWPDKLIRPASANAV